MGNPDCESGVDFVPQFGPKFGIYGGLRLPEMLSEGWFERR